MGWFSDDAPDHEGYPVALVERDGPMRGLHFAELHSGDAAATGITTIQAACECGWRSERITLREPVEWDGIVYGPEHVRDRAARLWHEHIALVYWRRCVAQSPHPAEPEGTRGRARTLAALSAHLVADLEAVQLCRCGHERREHRAAGVGARGGAGGAPGQPGGDGESGSACRGVASHRLPGIIINGAQCGCSGFRHMPTPP